MSSDSFLLIIKFWDADCSMWGLKIYTKNTKDLTLKNRDCTSSYSRSCCLNHRSTGWRSISKLKTICFAMRHHNECLRHFWSNQKERKAIQMALLTSKVLNVRRANTVGSCALMLLQARMHLCSRESHYCYLKQ